MRRRLSEDDYVEGVLTGDRAILGRAVTLVESTHPDHRAMADAVLARLLPHAGGAHRIGVSGVPGVGKSTLLEALGMHLLDQGRRVAVLAIDPSSTRTGGSILGDKTRMARLAADARAYVRPSPTSGALGGVTRATRETIRLVEAAGYDVVFVETVGVGQSEIEVAEMVDTFLLLLLAGAGDELQGIKKGILEVADVVAVNKADGDNAVAATRAAREYAGALHFVAPAHPSWTVPVCTCSGLTGTGLPELWETLRSHRQVMEADGGFDARRRDQRLRWMWALAQAEVWRAFLAEPAVKEALRDVEGAVREDRMSPAVAAERLLDTWRRT